MQNETKIEWSKRRWNPIKGICPEGCEYCWAKRQYKRFKWPVELRLDEKELIRPYSWKSSKIFACTTIDLYHPNIPYEWQKKVVKVISDLSNRHTWQILTKHPEEIFPRPYASGSGRIWMGISLENNNWERFNHFNGFMIAHNGQRLFNKKPRPYLPFVSFEPLLERIEEDFLESIMEAVEWVIIGRLTGHGRKRDPEPRWVWDIINAAKKQNLPVFIKNNIFKMVHDNQEKYHDIFKGFTKLLMEFPDDPASV